MSNTITAFFKGRVGVAEAVYQNDYGIVMILDSIELPAHFDCYFSTLEQDEAIPGIGVGNRVAIPNDCLTRAGNVTLHIPLHTGQNDSEVEYIVYFKVIKRARPVDDGTPVQMSAIERALALLQDPIGNIEDIVNEALSFTGETFEEMKEDLNTFKNGIDERQDLVESQVANLATNVKANTVTTLWEGTLNTKGQSVTLSEDISNYDFIDIYTSGVETTYLRKPVSNTVSFEIQIQNMSDTASVPFIKWAESSLSISGKTATLNKTVIVSWEDFSAAPVISEATSTVDITRIDGVKIGSHESAELTDIRVGTGGQTYASAGEAVRKQFTDLKSDLTESENGIVHIDSSKFSRGAIQNDGTINSQTYYASNNADIEFDYPVKISVKNGYKYAFVTKVSDSVYSVGSLATYDYFVPANTPFRLKVGRVTETWGPADLSVFSRQIDIISKSEYLAELQSAEIEKLKNGRELITGSFTRGTLNSGQTIYASYRVCSLNVIRYSRKINIDANTGFRFALAFYDSNNVYTGDSGWKTNYICDANQGFKLLIARTEETESTSEIADVFDFLSKINIQTELLDYINDHSDGNGMPLLSRPIYSNGRAKLIAHTGYHADSPENTIPAFEAAGKRSFWGIESDLQQTSDGYYVMCHDSTVDRTTDGSGTISSMTLAQVRALHIKDYPLLQVPTFEEYLSICKRYGCVPMIEIKSTVTNSTASFESIIAIVKKYGFDDNSVIFIGSKWCTANFKAASSKIAYMPVFQNGLSYDWDAEFASLSVYDNVGLAWDILDTITFERATQCHNNGMLYGTFTVDNVDTVKSAFEAGVDFVTTNTVLPTD